MALNSRTVLSSMVWNLLEKFSSQIVSFVISIVLARILMPSDYGIIAIILVFVTLANVIIDGGLNTALIQKKDADQTDFSTIFWFCLSVAALLYSILFFGAPLVARFYDNELLTPVLRVLSLGIFLNSFNSIQRAYVSRNMLFKKLFYVSFVAVVISGGLGIAMAMNGYGVWALVGQSLASPLVCCIIMWFTVRWRPTWEFSKDSFKGLFNYGWKIFLTNFIIALFGDIRSLLIGKVYSPADLAFFDRGKHFSSLIMTNVTRSIDTVMLPAFSSEQDNAVRVKQMMRRSIQVSYLFVAPLMIGMFFASKEIVILLLTEKWMPAVPFLQIFCVANLLMPIQNLNAIAIRSLGYSNITLKLEVYKKILEAAILVVSFLINVYAVALGVVVYNFICLFINLKPIERIVGYKVFEQIKDIFPTLMSAMVMGGGIYTCELLPTSSIITLIIQFLTGSIIYLIMLRLLKVDSYDYVRGYIMQIMGKFRN